MLEFNKKRFAELLLAAPKNEPLFEAPQHSPYVQTLLDTFEREGKIDLTKIDLDAFELKHVTPLGYEGIYINVADGWTNPSAPIKKRPPSNDRVFFCGHCGRKLQKTYGTDAYFSCSTPKYQADCACSQTRYSKTDLEAVLLPIYRMQLDLLDKQAAQHEEAHKSLNAHGYIKKMARIEKSIAACDTQKLALFEAYHSGNIDLETFVERKTALSDQQTQLRAEYQKAETDYAEKKQEFERLQEESRQIADYLSGQSLPDDKALEKMYEAIDRVTIHGANEIDIRWKFEDLFQNMQRPHPQKQAI